MLAVEQFVSGVAMRATPASILLAAARLARRDSLAQVRCFERRVQGALRVRTHGGLVQPAETTPSWYCVRKLTQ